LVDRWTSVKLHQEQVDLASHSLLGLLNYEDINYEDINYADIT